MSSTPTALLASNQYGKSRVRLLKVNRSPTRTDLFDWTLGILLQGDFADVHTLGDNTGLLTTDAMKNTVYALARESSSTTMEHFAAELAAHLLLRSPRATSARISIESALWKRLEFDGTPDPFSFMRGSHELQHTAVHLVRNGDPVTTSGLRDLVLLKTTRSGFSGFLRDDRTTLPDTDDRLLGTAVSATWTYTTPPGSFDHTRDTLRESMLRAFADHDSQSVQHTLFRMGEAALASTPEISSIDLSLPNRHNLLANLAPFGLDNPNQIFIPTDEPHGLIEATVTRATAPPSSPGSGLSS